MYDTIKEWSVHAADGTDIFFNKYTRLYNRMTYLDIHENQTGFAMLQKVRNKFEGFTKKQIEKPTLAK